MAERLTHQETELFYDLTTEFPEYDPGLDAFSDTVRRAEAFLNDDGGYQSMSYRGVLMELNDQWDFLDQTATVSGRMYVLEDGLTPLAPGEWNGPHRDERGTYFLVQDVELVSLGVIDRLEQVPGMVDEEGILRQPVELAYGFNPDDLESDAPIFYARPDDILSARYDMPTLAAIDSRLHARWPKQMDTLDRRIDAAGLDPMKVVTNLRSFTKRFEDTLLSSEDLRMWLGRYVNARIEFDKTWPYGVMMQGDTTMILPDGSMEAVRLDAPTLQYLKSAGVSLEHHRHPDGTEAAQMSLLFYAPAARTEDEYSDLMLSVPLSSVSGIFSTRPMGSLAESLELASSHAEPVEADMELVTSADDAPVHDRQREFERLVAFERLLKEMVKRTDQLRRTRHHEQRDALEASSVIIRWFHEEIGALGLQPSDLLRISGDGVIKAQGNIVQSETGFRIDVDQENPIVTPTAAADVYGCYDGVVAEVDRFEDDEGEEFWLPAPKLALMTQNISTPVIPTNYPVLSVAVKSVAIARLDGTAKFELVELDRMRRRRESLSRLGKVARGSRLLGDMKQLDRAFYSESPDGWQDAARMLTYIRRTAKGLSDGPTTEAGTEALGAQLIGRKVRIVGDTWVGDEYVTHAFSEGAIVDVYQATLPNGTVEMVAALGDGSAEDDAAKYAERSRLIVLKTVEQLMF